MTEKTLKYISNEDNYQIIKGPNAHFITSKADIRTV